MRCVLTESTKTQMATSHVEIESLKMTLDGIVEFLQQFRWLHDFSMIQVLLKDSVISKLPEDWKTWFTNNNHLESLLLSFEIIDCSSLKAFVSKCKQYTIVSLLQTQCQYLSFESVVNEVSLHRNQGKSVLGLLETEAISSSSTQKWISKEKSPWNALKRVSPKKKHEIERLSHFLHKLKIISGSNKILDIGSGLGFLDLFLHWNYNYKVVGAEASVEKVNLALKLRERYFEKACPDVHFIPWLLKNDLDTIQKSRKIIADLFNSSSSCMCVSKTEQRTVDREMKDIVLISLHSCGDLSPIMLEVFECNCELSSIVMMSCCYHKMMPTGLGGSSSDCKVYAKFEKFPLSRNLKKVMEERKFCLNICSLRLASEESIAHWKNRSKDCLSDDIKSIAYRSLLQNICDKNKIKLKKLRRHCTKKSLFSSFHDYVELVIKDYKFITANSDDWTDYELLKSQLYEEYLEQEENIELVGFVRFLQLSLQPVLESLILIDRVMYLKECGFMHCGLVQLFDEVESPRNKAIFGFRDQVNTTNWNEV